MPAQPPMPAKRRRVTTPPSRQPPSIEVRFSVPPPAPILTLPCAPHASTHQPTPRGETGVRLIARRHRIQLRDDAGRPSKSAPLASKLRHDLTERGAVKGNHIAVHEAVPRDHLGRSTGDAFPVHRRVPYERVELPVLTAGIDAVGKIAQ